MENTVKSKNGEYIGIENRECNEIENMKNTMKSKHGECNIKNEESSKIKKMCLLI